MGAIAHSIQGKLEGSCFRVNTYGVTLYSNNWSKRGRGARHFKNRFQTASIASAWRSLTKEEKDSWNIAYIDYPGSVAVTRNKPMIGSTKTFGV